MMANLIERLLKIRIINFMIVGTFGGLVSFAIYYPLTFYFKDSVHFLGQIFYLPAVIPSTVAGVTFNYFMNRKWTYGDCKAKRMSLVRYELIGLSTAILDITVLFLLVQYAHVFYLIAPVLAVCCMFIVRYFLINKLVWNTKGRNYEISP
jgi:putative flippase GtrA